MKPRLYFKEHKNQPREAEFARFLREHLDVDYVADSFPLPSYFEKCTLRTEKIIRRLQCDRYLPPAKRDQMVKELEHLPDELKVVNTMRRISCDIVIDAHDEIYFWEFHEQQHRNLSVSRLTPIYGVDGSEYRIPRFVQRFVRDLWRMFYFPNLSVVWFDWFEKHSNDYSPSLSTGFYEFGLPDKFRFSEFRSDCREDTVGR